MNKMPGFIEHDFCYSCKAGFFCRWNNTSKLICSSCETWVVESDIPREILTAKQFFDVLETLSLASGTTQEAKKKNVVLRVKMIQMRDFDIRRQTLVNARGSKWSIECLIARLDQFKPKGM